MVISFCLFILYTSPMLTPFIRKCVAKLCLRDCQQNVRLKQQNIFNDQEIFCFLNYLRYIRFRRKNDEVGRHRCYIRLMRNTGQQTLFTPETEVILRHSQDGPTRERFGRIDRDAELRARLLPLCRLQSGEIWQDPICGHRVGM